MVLSEAALIWVLLLVQAITLAGVGWLLRRRGAATPDVEPVPLPTPGARSVTIHLLDRARQPAFEVHTHTLAQTPRVYLHQGRRYVFETRVPGGLQYVAE